MPNDAEGSVLTGNPDASVEAPAWDQDLGDYSDLISAKGWAGPGDVLQSYMNLEKAVGADKVILPSADTDLAEWEGWTKLGTPEAADGYDLAAPEGFEQYDQGLSDWFREAAHAAKLPAPMAQRLHDQFVERMASTYQEQVDASTQQQTAWEEQLKKEYGTTFDERVSAARAAIREFGTPELQQVLQETRLGSHPEIVRAFARAGMAIGTGPQFKEAESSGQFGTTPDAAKDQIASIRANPALYDKGHAEYKLLNEKLTRLTELAYGNDPVR